MREGMGQAGRQRGEAHAPSAGTPAASAAARTVPARGGEPPTPRLQGVHPGVRLLVESGLVEAPVLELACGFGANTLELARQGHEAWALGTDPRKLAGARATAQREGLRARFLHLEPSRADALGRSFRTVLDNGWLHRLAPAQRDAYLDLLARLVAPDGYLHVLVLSDRAPGSAPPPAGCEPFGQADLLRAFRRGWTLLALHDSWVLDADGRPRHAWLGSFVRTPRPQPTGSSRSPIRNFTDLGAFGSLGIGDGRFDEPARPARPARTRHVDEGEDPAPADRPPWGM